MSTYLIKVTEQYRCDSEAEADTLIKEAKQDSRYTVIKSSNEIKVTKTDEWRRVIITKEFTSEKEPDAQVKPEYMED